MTDIITRANALLSDLQTGGDVDWTEIVAVLSDLILDHADARRDVLLQAARLAALESELATLQASVVAALSSAGPEVGEDERAG
jgi:hypothetical protein